MTASGQSGRATPVPVRSRKLSLPTFWLVLRHTREHQRAAGIHIKMGDTTDPRLAQNATLAVIIGINNHAKTARVVEVTSANGGWRTAAQLQHLIERMADENSGKTHFGSERLAEWQKQYRDLKEQLPRTDLPIADTNKAHIGQVHRYVPDGGYISMTSIQVSFMANLATPAA